MDTEYKIILSKKFDKSFNQLDTITQKRIVERLKDLINYPKAGKPLKGRFKGLWSLRVGKYRIIYEIEENFLVIIIIAIGHRKSVYE